MKNFKGVAIGPARSIKDRDLKREIQRIWDSIQPLDHWARGASQGFGRISHGQVPDGSGTMIGSMAPIDQDLTSLAGLTGTGIAARIADNVWALRTLQAPAEGLTIANPAGVAGNPTFALANDLGALEGLSGTGIARRTGTDAWSVGTTVSIAEGGTGQVAQTAAFNALDPLTTLGDIVYHNGTDSVRLPGNTTAIQLFMSQTGTGSVSAAPAWVSVPASDPLDLTERVTPANPATNSTRIFARANGGFTDIIALGSSGEECLVCSVSDFVHVNTMLFNGIE